VGALTYVLVLFCWFLGLVIGNLVIRYIEQLKLLTTNRYNALTSLRALQITSADANFQSVMSAVVTA
jgi:hypothetical protein